MYQWQIQKEWFVVCNVLLHELDRQIDQVAVDRLARGDIVQLDIAGGLPPVVSYIKRRLTLFLP
jgi:hypothetical protein